jgi:hypothetical protein
VDEFGAELDGMVQVRIVDGMDAAADSVAGLEHDDAPAGGTQPVRGGESRQAGSKDNDVRNRHAFYS